MVRPLLSLGLLLLSLALTSSVLYMDAYFYRGVSLGEHSAPTPNLPGNGMGVNTFLDRETDPQTITRTLEMIRQAGFTWVRQEFPWEDIEPMPGVYERSDTTGGKVSTWTKYDLIVAEADRLGLNLLIRLDRPPAWARQKGLATSKPNSTGPPDDFATFANFASRVAERYKGKPRYYQVWNEPNLHSEWNDQPIDPSGFVRLLALAYRAIKESDPQATVVMAGLAPTDQLGPENLNDLIFLEEAYRAGLSKYFDVMAVMVYGLGYPPQDRRTDLFRANFSRPALVYDIMVRYGDASKPVIAAEYAWISLPPDWMGRPSIWGDSISEELQARYLVDGYRRARSEWPWLSAMFVWAFKWPSSGPMDPWDPTPYFAIVHPDFRPRPAYHALATLTSTPVLGVGRHRLTVLNTRFLTYANRVDLILIQPAAPTFAVVQIDGAERKVVTLSPGRNIVTDGLADGPHQVSIELAAPVTVDIDLIRQPPLPYGTLWSPVVGLVGSAAAVFSVLIGLSTWVQKQRHALAPLLEALRHPSRSYPKAAAWAESTLTRGRGRLAVSCVTLLLVAVVILDAPKQLLPVYLLTFAVFSALWPGPGLAGVLASLGFVFRPVETPAGQFAAAELLALAWIAGSWIGLALGRWPPPSRYTASPAERGGDTSNLIASLVLPGIFFIIATLSLLIPPPYWLKYAVREYRTVILEPILVYATMLALAHRLGDLRWLLAGLSVGSATVAIIGILQYASGSDLVVAEGAARITSAYKHPNNLALFLDRTVPYAVVLAISLRNPWRWCALCLAGLSLLAMILTFSRGAWVATVAALVAGFLFQRRSRLALAGAMVSSVLLALLAVFQVARFGDLLQLGSGSASLRILLWSAAVNMIRDHPITGLGLDQFLYYYNPQYVLPGAWEERFTSHAHNLVLDLWTRLGIIGLAAGIALIVVLLRLGISMLKAARGPDRWTLLGVLSSTTAMLVHGMVDNAFFSVDLSYIFWTSYGMAVTVALRTRAIAEAPVDRGGKRLEVKSS
jgi:O-antigen ligase